MAMQISNLSKGIVIIALSMMWGLSNAGDMMNDHSMKGDDKMMESSDKTMEMDKSDSMKSEGEMKTMEGDMKAMEAEMNMEKKDSMEMDKEEGNTMMDEKMK